MVSLASETTRRSRKKISKAEVTDWLIVATLTAAGLLFPEPALWYSSLGYAYLFIALPVLAGCGLMHSISKRWGKRIQGERKTDRRVMLAEAYETARAMWVVSTLAAWPIAMDRAGMPTGLTWSLEDVGGLGLAIVQIWGGIIVIDAWSYWKHRLLHTRRFFPFHKQHHSFRDPTPFAGFAVAPFESVLTFWPLVIICWPPAKHFAPLYFSAIGSFVVLNFYLHCGVTYRWAEKLLPRLLLNSSAWHNIHHSHANANFGEVSFVWDRICKTSLADVERRKQERREARSLET